MRSVSHPCIIVHVVNPNIILQSYIIITYSSWKQLMGGLKHVYLRYTYIYTTIQSKHKCIYTYKFHVAWGVLAGVSNAQYLSDKTINWKMKIHLGSCNEQANKLKINQMMWTCE